MKPVLYEARQWYTGGLATSVTADMLKPEQLVTATNFRVEETVGDLTPRLGTRRVHTTSLGASVDGLFQWDYNGSKQLVAVANGDLHYKTTDYGEFSASSPTPVLASNPTRFATSRAATASAPLYLYLVDGDNYWRWTGAALTQLTTGVPADPYLLASYHIRNFMVGLTKQQTLVYTVLGDPEDFTIGNEAQGGEAMVDVMRGEPLTALEVVGSSLLLCTADSVARFLGYSSRDIQIQQDTEGISADVGVVGRNALLRVGPFAAGFSDRGPIAVNEANLEMLDQGLMKPTWRALDRTALANICVGWHDGRREIWFAVPGASDSGLNKSVYVFNLDLGAWYGPFTYPFGITCFASVEDSNGDETLYAGCSDGFVRHMDTGYLDDVLADASGGSSFTASAELKPMVFDKLGWLKTLQRVDVTGIVPSGETLVVGWAMDGAVWQTKNVAGTASTRVSHRVDIGDQGERLRLKLEVTPSAAQTQVSSVIAKAFDMQRHE